MVISDVFKVLNTGVKNYLFVFIDEEDFGIFDVIIVRDVFGKDIIKGKRKLV